MIRIKLNEAEREDLFRQDPATRKDGGFQGLLVGFRNMLLDIDVVGGKIV